jgi:hypothetical protein
MLNRSGGIGLPVLAPDLKGNISVSPCEYGVRQRHFINDFHCVEVVFFSS